jgi:hypothetical protein
MSTCLDEQLIAFDLDFIAIQWPGRRARDHEAFFVELTIMARAKEQIALGNPAHAASQMSADVRHRRIITTIVGEHIHRQFLFICDPSCLLFTVTLKVWGRPANFGRGMVDPAVCCFAAGNDVCQRGDGYSALMNPQWPWQQHENAAMSLFTHCLSFVPDRQLLLGATDLH